MMLERIVSNGFSSDLFADDICRHCVINNLLFLYAQFSTVSIHPTHSTVNDNHWTAYVDRLTTLEGRATYVRRRILWDNWISTKDNLNGYSSSLSCYFPFGDQI